jgi:DNA polymerase elongation subunit (family B)
MTKMTKQELINKINALKKEKQQLKDLANVQDLRQQAFKIFLNSSYGALGSVFYPCFDLDNAEAVTLSGQSVTREMVRFTNEILNNLANSENDEFVVAGDTDSISGESKITINGIKFTIEELYNLLVKEGNQVDLLKNGTEVVLSEKTNYLTESINGLNTIKNVSRHKVSKGKWSVEIPGKETLYMTEDHSLIVYRDGELVECKPSEVLKSDYLVIK